MKKRFLLLIAFFYLGCAKEQVVEIPFQKNELKNIKKVAILCPNDRPDLFMNVAGDQHIPLFFLSPALIPQLFSAMSYIDARKTDSRLFNSLTFDMHIGHVIREYLYRKLQRSASFSVISPEEVEACKVAHKLQGSEQKAPEDYEQLGKHLGADTVIELFVLSYGMKDPGVFSKPYAVLKVKASMRRVRDGTLLWQTMMVQTLSQQTRTFGFDYEKYSDENAKLLKEELDKLAGVLAERLVEAIGFKCQLPTARLLKMRSN
ncbi:MAG TPA: hypothetical protein ACFYD3_03565 [Candidatus Hypogeohydataceae bacterium YC41]